MTYTINFGRHQLTVNLNRRVGRPPKRLSIRARQYWSFLVQLATDKHFRGHPASRILRRLFENKKIKKALSFDLTLMVLLTGIAIPPSSAFKNHPETEITVLKSDSVEPITKKSVRAPLDSFFITQGYHPFHHAIDLRGAIGTPIYPIMDGVVENVLYDRFGYGNHIIINHGSGFKSLYAHLSKTIVKKGDRVDQNTVIGLVGATGWATGPHLHLEVWENGHPINPLTILK